MRKPFQGVSNIFRFNWHFYLIALVSVALLMIINQWLTRDFQLITFGIAFLIFASTSTSLAVSTYIYDLSGFYNFEWLKLKIHPDEKVLNINAGFDETSKILKDKFNLINLQVFDFYDPNQHTEISIKRARKAYPPFGETQKIPTSSFPLKDNSIDKAFIIFSAHEIRKSEERIQFFKEIRRVLQTKGIVIVVEHLRDIPNFVAYNIGFFHFLSEGSWHKTFREAQLKTIDEFKLTPFVTASILSKDGNTY